MLNGPGEGFCLSVQTGGGEEGNERSTWWIAGAGLYSGSTGHGPASGSSPTVVVVVVTGVRKRERERERESCGAPMYDVP